MWIILLLVSIAFSLWVYRGAIRRLWYLAALRGLATFLILIVALKPIYYHKKVIPTPVDVLIDKSGSMGFEDKSKFLSSIINGLKHYKSRNLSFNFYSFDTTVSPGINLNFGGKTNISIAIDSAKSGYVILLSDGLNNRGGYPITKGKTIISFPPPSPKALLKELTYRPVVIEGTTDTIKLTPGKSGYLEIFDGGRLIYKKRLGENTPETIPLNLKAPGFHAITLKFNGKTVRKFTIRVIKRGKKVLIYASHPDVNIRFLRMYIEHRGNISPDFIIKTVKGLELYEQDTVIKLRKFDPSGYDFYVFIDPQPDVIKPLLNGSKGLILFTRPPSVLNQLLGGKYFPSKLSGELYPHWQDTLLAPVGYVWALNRYPPEIESPVYIKQANRDIPLLFFTDHLAFIMSGEFFHVALFDFKTFSSIMDQVFSRLIPEGSFFVELPTRQFEAGEKIPVTAYAFDRFGNAIDTLFPVVEINGENYPMNYSGKGRYSTYITLKDTGKIEAKVVFKGPGGVVKKENIELKVTSSSTETPTPEIDINFLKSLGKVVFKKSTLYHELRLIKPTSIREKLDIRNSLWILLLAVTILGIEWFLRRANGVV